jgi:hypothetical protein
MSRLQEYTERVQNAVNCAVDGKTKLTPNQLDLEGMSSKKNRILLNELVKDGDRYLEIGVWKGSTFVSALYGNKYESAVAIDNFSQFDGDRQKFFDHCALSEIKDFTFINNDCFKLPPEEKEHVSKINVYFYDGDHREEDQKLALTYYLDNLADEFIFIVDDWNHPPAKSGTYLGLKESNLKVHQEWQLKADHNGDRATWWNGIYIAICEKQK